MKKVLTALLSASLVSPAFAGITAEEASSLNYLKNHGHSDSIVELVEMSKASANGEAYITMDEARHANDTKFVKFWRKVLIYFDPAQDDGQFMRHNSKITPSTDDL